MRTLKVVGMTLGAAVAGVMLASPASAHGTVVADFHMEESAGATQMKDSSGATRTTFVGSGVDTGAAYGSGKGYQFTSPGSGIASGKYLVSVYDSASLDPGSRHLHIELGIKTADRDANLLQKGQAGTYGGYYKMEINAGKAACSFSGSVRQRLVTSGTTVSDGKPHTIVCEKATDYVRIMVDGGSWTYAWNGVGSISNAKRLSIGGKYECDGGSVDCDYYTGLMDYAKITIL